jgi:hypothetical protein
LRQLGGVSLKQAHHGDLAGIGGSAASPNVQLPPTPSVHVSRLAADVGFVNFNFAGHLVERSRVQGIAKPMHQEPR